MILSSQQNQAVATPVDLNSISNLWRASELARARGATKSTGYPVLDAEMPGGGWPRSAVTELLVTQHGVGEMRLIKPALAALSGAQQRIALVQPTYIPQAAAMRNWGIADRDLMWIQTNKNADALWATEQILKNGSVGGVILWQTAISPEAVRRLNLAAQSAETWFWIVRPHSAAVAASPAPLRMCVSPAVGGVMVDIIKRKGPHSDKPFYLHMPDMPCQAEQVRQSIFSRPASEAAPMGKLALV